MGTKTYKLLATVTGTTNAAASLKITRAGTITGIAFALDLLGGAGVSRLQYELSKQNTSSLAVNDTPDVVLASASIASPNAVHAAENALIAGLAIPVEIGDSLYINVLFTGAVAPNGANCNCYVYVQVK